MKAPMKRILLYLLCLVAITSCNGAALKSLRGLFKSFKSVPTKELVRRVPKTAPKTGEKSLGWARGIDDVVRAVSKNDSTFFSSPEETQKYVTPKYNGDINSYQPGGNAPFKFKTVDVTITAPKVDLAPPSSGVNLNRNSGGYKPNPSVGTSNQLQLNKPATLYPNSGLQ